MPLHILKLCVGADSIRDLEDWIADIDPNVWARIRSFGEMPAGEYIRRRRRVLAWMEEAQTRLADLDAFVTPTIAITAPPVAAVEALDDYRRHNTAASRNAAILSLLDFCAVSLPVGRDLAGIPVGMQVAARRGEERGLTALCVAIERRLGTPLARLGVPPEVAQ